MEEEEVTNLDRICFAGIQIANSLGLISNPELRFAKKFQLQTMEDLVLRIIKDYYEHGILTENTTKIPIEIIAGFTYCFDKGVEMAYVFNQGEDYIALDDEYSFDDWYNGFSGDTVSESIQIIVNEQIPIVGELFKLLNEFYDNLLLLNPEDMGIHEVIYTFLSTNSMIGFEFCNEILSQ